MTKLLLLILGAVVAFICIVGAIVAAAPWIAGFIVLAVLIWFCKDKDFNEPSE